MISIDQIIMDIENTKLSRIRKLELIVSFLLCFVKGKGVIPKEEYEYFLERLKREEYEQGK